MRNDEMAKRESRVLHVQMGLTVGVAQDVAISSLPSRWKQLRIRIREHLEIIML